jgi:CelD/BcsL family acetyltransferase involved in cellulose biosynthesis
MKSLGQSMALVETGSITYEVLDQLSEIEAIAGEWDSLLDRSPCNRAFSCSQWFIVSCSLDQSLAPRVLIARREGVIAGVLPMVLHHDSGVATFVSELCDYNDIVALENDETIVAGLLNFAISHQDGYRRIILSRLRSDSNCLRGARALDPAHDFDHQLTGGTQYVQLPATFEEYLNTRSKNFRKSLRRAQRNAGDCDLTIHELHPESFPPDGVAKLFLSLNVDRWGAESYYHLPFPQSFVLKLLPHLFAEGRMRVFALTQADKLLGLDLCMIGKNSLCTWNGGFLAASERWSPGNLLIAAGIRRAFDLKLAEYDLLRGNESYKKRWANNVRPMLKIEFDVVDNQALMMPQNKDEPHEAHDL